jgi:polysaccharide biosynthesis/export protein
MGEFVYAGRKCLLGFVTILVVLSSSWLVAQEKATTPAQSSPAAIPTQNDSQKAPSSDTPSVADSGDMHFGPGDLLEVSVYGVPELTTKARISSAGDVYLPLIDYVHLEGLTPQEAQGIIEKRLADGGYVKNPHVQIYINEYASQAVSVLGEVTRPGPVTIMGERRLYDVISAAGGLTDKAGRNVTIAHRSTPDKPATIHLAEGLAQTAESNVPVKPGDTIVIQRAGIVYVVGDVNRPSGFLIDNANLTVLKLVALAGGTTRTAKLNGSKILRKTPDGIKETRIPLKKILQAKAPDVPLQADDILFVPGSAAKAAAYRGTESVLQAATALSIVAFRP